jgi:putative addiction module component (TIGR02574 family)
MPRRALDEILDLPIGERLRALDEIWESIVTSPELLSLPESQRRELERRLKLYLENPDDTVPWEEIRSRLLGTG